MLNSQNDISFSRGSICYLEIGKKNVMAHVTKESALALLAVFSRL